jgi:hypothetical protein
LGERQLDKLEVTGSSPVAPIAVLGYGRRVGRGRSFSLLIVAAVIGAAFATLVAASAATAAVTLGRTAQPFQTCQPDDYFAQVSTTGGPEYSVPAGFGVITSWSFMGAASGSGTVNLIVWRPTATANEYIYLDRSPSETYIPEALRTFLVRIPVQPNDVLGLHTSEVVFCLLNDSSTTGDTVRLVETATEPAKGSPQNLAGEITDEDLLVSAVVETDTDRDGFGDDTQDKCVGTPGQFSGCPNTVTAIKLKQKGDKKVRATITVPGQGALKVGSPSDPALASAAKKTVKAVSAAVTATTAQQLKLTLKLTKSASGQLAKAGKLKLKVKAVFTPSGGPAGSTIKKKKLKS